MTLSYSGRSGTGSVDGSGSAVTAAYSSANVAGNLLIAHVGWVDGSGSVNCDSLTDTNLNRWFPARTKTRNATNTYTVQIWYSFGNKAGANTVQANFSTATTFTRIGVAEYQSSNGSFWTDPLDQTNGNTGNSNAPSAGNVTPTLPNELVVSTCGINSGTLSAGSGYALRTTPTIDVRMEEQFQTTATLTTGAFSGSASDQWACQVATFEDVAAPPQYNRFPPPIVVYFLAAAVQSRDAGVAQPLTQSADATLDVTAGFTATGATDKPVTASLAATATITAAATVTKPVDATLAVTASLTASATTTKPILATPTFTAGLTGTAATDKPIAASPTFTAGVTATGSSDKPVAASLTVTAGRTASADTTKPIAATLAVTATISADASIGGATKSADVTLAGTASLTAMAATDKPVAATLAVTSSVTGTAATDKPVTAAVAGAVGLTATATSTKPADATLAVSVGLTAAATLLPAGKNIDAAVPVVATITAVLVGEVGSGAAAVTFSGPAAMTASVRSVSNAATAEAVTGTVSPAHRTTTGGGT